MIEQCLDADSPWLICKPCAASGQCAMRVVPSADDESVYCPTCGAEDSGTSCGIPGCGLVSG